MKKRGLMLLSLLCGTVLFSGCISNFNSDSGQQTSSDKKNSSESSSVVEEKVYTITFKQDGFRDVTRTVKEGEDLEDIPEPQDKVGYTVIWEEVDLTDIQSDITVDAQEEANEYTVTYDANGGTVTPKTQEVTYDSEVELATPEKDGYEFLHWTYEGAKVSNKWNIAKDVTIVAEWRELKKEKVTVSFVQEGQETDSVEINKGEAVAAEDIPDLVQKTGYTVAWDKALPESITESITLTAVYTANKYTITYDANGGSVTPASEEVTYDSAVTLATPTRDGYNFLGWTYEDKAVATDKWSIADNVTLVANWQEIVKYTVSFVQEGQETVSLKVEQGKGVTAEDIPELVQKTGYTVAWDKALPESITESITLTAVYTANKYTITYDANGGSVTPTSEEVTYDSAVTLATPTRDGYNFIGWTYEGKVVSTDKWSIADNVTLIANWQEIEKFTVSFVQAGEELKTIEVYEGGSVAAEDIPALVGKTGYTVAWDKDLPESITESITLTAVYTANTYTITYDANGGSVTPASEDVTYDGAVTLATPTRDGYNFLGWTYEDKAVATDKWSIADNVTLVANWQEIVKYTVSFVQEGQETVNLKVEQGKGVSADDIPDLVGKTGYSVAWNKELPEIITESITLTAVYTANKYTITYDANGGSVTPASEEVTYDSAVTLATPTRDGYNFLGWTYEGKVVSTDKWSIADNVTLVADWQEIVIVKYTVSFVQEGFETINIEVKEGDSLAEADMPKPQSKTGYIVAWENKDLTNIQGNITVNAVETVKKYTVVLNANGGTASVSSFEIKYGETYELPTPTNGSKTFKGWKYNGTVVDLKGTWNIDGADTITLIAEWINNADDNNWTNNY